MTKTRFLFKRIPYVSLDYNKEKTTNNIIPKENTARGPLGRVGVRGKRLPKNLQELTHALMKVQYSSKISENVL